MINYWIHLIRGSVLLGNFFPSIFFGDKSFLGDLHMPWVLKKQARKIVLFLYPTWNQYFILKNEVTD